MRRGRFANKMAESGKEMSNIFTTETEGNASLKRKINSEGDFEGYGFGYNGFMQLLFLKVTKNLHRTLLIVSLFPSRHYYIPWL